MLYQMVELEEGVDVQYLGVYALKWKQEWGPPSVGFVESGYVPTDQHEWLLQEHKALQELLAVQDSELEQLNRNLEGHREANVQLKEDLRLESEADRRVCGRLAEAMECIKALQELLAIRGVELDEVRQIINVLEDQARRLDALTKAASDQLRAERDEARAAAQKLVKITTTSTCCAYCGKVLTEHLKVCPEHIETLEAEVVYWRTRCAEEVAEKNRYISELQERLVSAINLIF